jgi:DNA-binding MarR family transcriptional regulator
MTKRKWLDAEEQAAWYSIMATAMLLGEAIDRQLERDSGLTHAQYALLARLSMARGRMLHMNELAVLMSSSLSRLSHAVARLEQRGWVARSRCPENRRAVHATLTDSGYQLIRAAAPGHVREVRRLVFEGLTREQIRQMATITAHTIKVLSDEGYAIPPW